MTHDLSTSSPEEDQQYAVEGVTLYIISDYIVRQLLLFTTMNNNNLFSEIKNKSCSLLIVQVLAIFDNTF